MTPRDYPDILIVDDHQLYCDALSFALEQTAGLKARIATDLQSARDVIATVETPMIVLLDLMIPGTSGLEAVEEFVGANGGHKVIVVSSATYDSDLAERLNKIGAKGFIPKTMRLSSIGKVIELVHLGDKYFPHAAKDSGARGGNSSANLTDLDLEILKRMSQGQTNRDIGHWLDMDEMVVRARVQRIYGLIGARNRAHAVLQAVRAGLIEPHA